MNLKYEVHLNQYNDTRISEGDLGLHLTENNSLVRDTSVLL